MACEFAPVTLEDKLPILSVSLFEFPGSFEIPKVGTEDVARDERVLVLESERIADSGQLTWRTLSTHSVTAGFFVSAGFSSMGTLSKQSTWCAAVYSRIGDWSRDN